VITKMKFLKSYKCVSAIAVSFLLVFVSHKTKAQQSIEIGLMAGVANYYGDINPNFSLKQLGPSFGFLVKHNYNYYVGLKGTLAYGKVKADDSIRDLAFQEIRNLSFQSNIFEASGQIELNFFKYKLKDLDHFFTPYISTGLAFFHFNPKTEYRGEMINLVNVGTEGQNATDLTDNEPYQLNQFSIPIGLGFKYWVGGAWTFGAEVTYRKTFTDYLDDVSDIYIEDFLLDGPARDLSDPSIVDPKNISRPERMRGDRLSNDNYLFANIYFTYNFKLTKCPTAEKGIRNSILGN